MLDSQRRQVLVLGALGAAIAALMMGVIAYGNHQQRPVQVGAFATPYDERVLEDPLEILIVQNDGQAFATLARDPLLRRADEELRSPEEAAYRAQRPLLAYASWALSLGRSGWVPPALALLVVAGGGLAVSGVAALLARRGASPWYALLVTLLPGFYYSTTFLCPEPLALGLGAWGLYWWERERPRPAGVLLVLAALARETMLVGFGVLVLVALWRRDRGRVLAAASPFVAVGLWTAVLVARFGTLPTSASEGRLGWPLRGLLDALDRSSQVVETGNLLYLAIFVAIGVAALALARRDHLAWMAAAFLAFISLSGHNVWVEAGFARVMLPMAALGLVAVAGALSGRDAGARSAGTADGGSTPHRGTRQHEPGSPAAVPAPPSV